MLKAHSIGPRMIAWLEEIGIERLAGLRGADADQIAMRINIALGRRHLNRLGARHCETLSRWQMHNRIGEPGFVMPVLSLAGIVRRLSASPREIASWVPMTRFPH